jgi:hypothetical protein
MGTDTSRDDPTNLVFNEFALRCQSPKFRDKMLSKLLLVVFSALLVVFVPQPLEDACVEIKQEGPGKVSRSLLLKLAVPSDSTDVFISECATCRDQ